MPLAHRHFLVVADIEGSSGCRERAAAKFLTPQWAAACGAMTHDVNAAAQALFRAGAATVAVHDFHRTGYNLLAEYLDPRIDLHQGYRQGPVPGIGHPGPAQAALFLGMHGASGTDAFLAHTLTSRVTRLTINGRPLTELELFAASLAPHGIRPIFFSGCPIACNQARGAIPGIATWEIDKLKTAEVIDTFGTDPRGVNPRDWRCQLAQQVMAAAQQNGPPPYSPLGPFQARLRWKDDIRATRQLARRWGFACQGTNLIIERDDLNALYRDLINLCYLTPAGLALIPLALPLFNVIGRWGLAWVRRQMRNFP